MPLSLSKASRKKWPAAPVDPRSALWRPHAGQQLRDYLAGRITVFTPPCDLGALPTFTRAVAQLAVQFPYGEVRSYQWLAHELGKPRAAQAVGNAPACNPFQSSFLAIVWF